MIVPVRAHYTATVERKDYKETGAWPRHLIRTKKSYQRHIKKENTDIKGSEREVKERML